MAAAEHSSPCTCGATYKQSGSDKESNDDTCFTRFISSPLNICNDLIHARFCLRL
jgi:hypothetical protein